MFTDASVHPLARTHAYTHTHTYTNTHSHTQGKERLLLVQNGAFAGGVALVLLAAGLHYATVDENHLAGATNTLLLSHCYYYYYFTTNTSLLIIYY
jgi:hypothetical protein